MCSDCKQIFFFVNLDFQLIYDEFFDMCVILVKSRKFLQS